MNKKLVFIICLLCLSFAIFANAYQTSQEIVTVDFDSMPYEEQTAYMFLFGIEAMMQNKAKGALLLFDKQDNYLSGFLTDNTREDFCYKISNQTIATFQIVTPDIAKVFFAMLNDINSCRVLDTVQDDLVTVVVLAEFDKDSILEPVAYSWAKQQLNNSITAYGIELDDFYNYIFEKTSLTQENLIMAMYTEDKTALDYINYYLTNKKADKTNNSLLSQFAPTMIIVICVVGFLILAIGGYLGFSWLFRSKQNRIIRNQEIDFKEMENHDIIMENIENTDDIEEESDNE